jgi:hypothetical protein
MPVTSPPAGPVEWVAITFPGSGLGPEVTAPLAGLVDAKTVRVLDAVVVRKAADGTISEVEIDAGAPAFDQVDGEVLELLNHDDLLAIAGRLADDTTTLVVVWENLWAAAFAEAVRDRGGSVIAHDRVAPADVAAAVAALNDAAAETAQEGSPG